MRTWSFCVVAAVAAVALAVGYNALGENGNTDKKADCDKPTRDGTEVLRISFKDNGVNQNPIDVPVDILGTDTAAQKAQKIAAAITAANANLTAAAALNTVAVGGAGTGDSVTKVEWKDPPSPKKNSGEKRDSFACISSAATTGGFCVNGSGTGVSLDGFSAIVQVGTARGMAVVTTSAGMTVLQIRNSLLSQLQALGIAATALGGNRIEVEMQALDCNKISWGSSDDGVSVESSLE